MSNPNNTPRGWLRTTGEIAGALALYTGTALAASLLSGSAVVGAVFSNLMLFAAGFLWLRKQRRSGASPVPVHERPVTARGPAFWALMAFTLVQCWLVGQAASLWLYSYTGSENFDRHVSAKADAPLLMMLALVLILAPMGEEMLMRGIAYSRLRRHVNPFAAAVLTTLLFSLMHLNLVQIAVSLPLGFLLAIVYEQTGRLAPVITMHAVFNLLSVVMPASLVSGFATLTFVLLAGALVALQMGVLYRNATGTPHGTDSKAKAAVRNKLLR